MKRFFLVLLVLLAGTAVLSAGPPRPGGASDAPQMIMSLADGAVSIEAPGMSGSMLPGGGVVAQDNDAAVTEDIDLICLWAYKYLAGLLTEDEFTTLVAGRIAVMYMRDQADVTGGMRSLAKKTKEKADRFFLLQELKLGIIRIGRLAPDEFPLLC